MLKNRILSTLRFFDLMETPLTLLELHRFLISETTDLKTSLDSQWELNDINLQQNSSQVSISDVLKCLDTECGSQVLNDKGFYYLPGKREIVEKRLQNYSYGIIREKLIRKYISGLRLIPFIRGVGLTGSQAQGFQKPNSDIDLFIIVSHKFLWLARTLITAYFQFLGLRRHGNKISNRFCLNHYIVGQKQMDGFRNLYTAWEYAKLRPLVFASAIYDFQMKNLSWINIFFPNVTFFCIQDKASRYQKFLERIFDNKFGASFEVILKSWQLPKIRQEKFIVVKDDELSFHPLSKQQDLLRMFFG